MPKFFSNKLPRNASVLIFGAGGQDGFYLSSLCKHMGANVFQFSRKKGDIVGNVCNYQLVSKTIANLKPNYIINFAACSSVKHEYILKNHDTITTGSLNILEAVKIHSPHSKVFITGS